MEKKGRQREVFILEKNPKPSTRRFGRDNLGLSFCKKYLGSLKELLITE
jgi:hypothetical protein